MRVLILEPGGVDHPEFEPEQRGFAFAPVARHPGPVVDQREALSDQPVEQVDLPTLGRPTMATVGSGMGAR